MKKVSLLFFLALLTGFILMGNKSQTQAAEMKEDETYQVTFYQEDGTTVEASYSVGIGESLTAPEGPSKETVYSEDGKTATVWYFNQWMPFGVESSYTIENLSEVTQDMSFIATYNSDEFTSFRTFTVTYYKDSVSEDNLISRDSYDLLDTQLANANPYDLVNPNLDKYRPEGYQTGIFDFGDFNFGEGESSNAGMYFSEMSNLNIVYQEQLYTITYKLGAKTVTVAGNPDTYRFAEGEITLTNYPDSNFKGWYLSEDLSEQMISLSSDLFQSSKADLVRDESGQVTGIVIHGSLVAGYVDDNDSGSSEDSTEDSSSTETTTSDSETATQVASTVSTKTSQTIVAKAAKTSDNQKIEFYGGMLVLSFGILAGCFIRNRKKEV